MEVSGMARDGVYCVVWEIVGTCGVYGATLVYGSMCFVCHGTIMPYADVL